MTHLEAIKIARLHDKAVSAAVRYACAAPSTQTKIKLSYAMDRAELAFERALANATK
jgi:hypothetical protein